MPTYAEWLELFRDWADRYPNPHRAAIAMVEKLQAKEEKANKYTLMYHLRGDFATVGLELARTVAEVIAETEGDTPAWF